MVKEIYSEAKQIQGEEKEQQSKYSWLLYIVFSVLIVITISHKSGFFQDEILSYCLANNNEVIVRMARFSPRVVGNITNVKMIHNFVFTPSSAAFDRITSVPENDRFDYKEVWRRQAEDCHPPVFYAILHTVGSFFPGKFSRWHGGIINLVFALLMLLIARKLVKRFTDDKLTLCLISLIFIFSSALLNSTSFLRMYLMSMFCVLLETYLIIKLVDITTDNKNYIQIYFATLLGALTHYYGIIYIVIISLIFGLFLLIHGKWKEIAKFTMAQLLAALSACLVFPAMISHIFNGPRGEETMQNASNLADFGHRFTEYWEIVNKQLFGGLLLLILIFFLFVPIYRWYSKTDENCKDVAASSFEWQKMIILFLPSVIYFFVIAKVVPTVSEVYYGDIKYMYPIFATLLVSAFITLFVILGQIFTKKTAHVLMLFIAVLTIAGSWHYTDWNNYYLYRDYEKILNMKQPYFDSECICFYNSIMPVDIYELSCYRNIIFYPIDTFDPEKIKSVLANPEFPGKIVICIATQQNIDTDAMIDSLNPVLSSYSIVRTPLNYKLGDGTRAYGGFDGFIYHLTRN